VLIRRELPDDPPAIREVHADAFGPSQAEPRLVDQLRSGDAYLPPLSLVAVHEGRIVGHVICTRATLLPGDHPVLGLGPLGVRRRHQRGGVGSALMHAVLGAADALDEPLVVLLGHREYYPRFGFRPAAELRIAPEVPEWAPAFQARTLTSYRPELTGRFRYAPQFNDL
jgi:putative acetyltransferase